MKWSVVWSDHQIKWSKTRERTPALHQQDKHSLWAASCCVVSLFLLITSSEFWMTVSFRHCTLSKDCYDSRSASQNFRELDSSLFLLICNLSEQSQIRGTGSEKTAELTLWICCSEFWFISYYREHYQARQQVGCGQLEFKERQSIVSGLGSQIAQPVW